MKNLLIASTLALGLGGSALAGEGGHSPFPFETPGVQVANPPASFDVGSAAYPELPRAYSFEPTGVAVSEPQGQEGVVQTANSLPAGALEGTVGYAQEQSVARYFAQQASQGRFAALQRRQAN